MHIAVIITMSKEEAVLASLKSAQELMPDLLTFLNAPEGSDCNVHVNVTEEASTANLAHE